MWEQDVLTAHEPGIATSSDPSTDRRVSYVSFHGVMKPRRSGLGPYGNGFVQNNSKMHSSPSMGKRDTKSEYVMVKEENLNLQYQRLLEKPLFTKQDLADCEDDICKLQVEFCNENMDLVNILCQELNWPMHYKTIKPVSYFRFGISYTVRSTCLILAKDTENIFGENDHTCRKYLKHELRGAEVLQKRCRNEATAPLMILVDHFGQRLLISSCVNTSLKSCAVKVDGAEEELRIFRNAHNIPKEIEIIYGDDGRKYLFQCSKILPPLSPLFLVSGQSWVGTLYPALFSCPCKFITVPYILISDPTKLLQRVVEILGKPRSNAGFLLLADGTLIFFNGGDINDVNVRISRIIKREVRGNAILLSRYNYWNPWMRRFKAEMLSSRKSSQIYGEHNAFSSNISGDVLARANQCVLSHTKFILSDIVPQVAKDLVCHYAVLKNDEAALNAFCPPFFLHKHGLSLYFLGLVRKSISDQNLKDELLIEMIARTHRRRINSSIKRARCFHDDHIHEDRNRHLGVKCSKSSQWSEIMNTILLPQIYTIIIDQFNLVLGHVHKDSTLDSQCYMREVIKGDLWSLFPGGLDEIELAINYNLYYDGLDDYLRKKLFHRLQTLCGVTFSRKITGKRPLKVDYILTIKPKVKYFKPKLIMIDTNQKALAMENRLRRELDKLDSVVDAVHESVISKTFSLARILLLAKETTQDADQLMHTLAKTVRHKHGKKSSKYSSVIVEYGVIQNSLGNYKRAKKYFEEGMSLLSDIGGSNLAKCTTGLCRILIALDFTAEAKVLVSFNRGILEEMFGAGSTAVAEGFVCEALLHMSCSNSRKAKTVAHEAIAVLSLRKQTQHPMYGEALLIIAEIAYRDGNYEAAKTTSLDALDIFTEKLEKSNPCTIQARLHLAKYMCYMGKLKEAAFQLVMVKESLETRFFPKHPLYILWAQTQATLFFFEGNVSSSYDLIQIAKSISQEIFDQKHRTYLMLCVSEAQCLQVLGRLSASRASLLHVIASLQPNALERLDELEYAYVTFAKLEYLMGRYRSSHRLCMKILYSSQVRHSSGYYGIVAAILLEKNKIQFGDFLSAIHALQRICTRLENYSGSPYLILRAYLLLSEVYTQTANDVSSLSYAEKALTVAYSIYGMSGKNIVIAECKLRVGNVLIDLASTNYAHLILNGVVNQIASFCDNQCCSRDHYLYIDLLVSLFRLAYALCNYKDAAELSANSIVASVVILNIKVLVLMADYQEAQRLLDLYFGTPTSLENISYPVFIAMHIEKLRLCSEQAGIDSFDKLISKIGDSKTNVFLSKFAEFFKLRGDIELMRGSYATAAKYYESAYEILCIRYHWLDNDRTLILGNKKFYFHIKHAELAASLANVYCYMEHFQDSYKYSSAAIAIFRTIYPYHSSVGNVLKIFLLGYVLFREKQITSHCPVSFDNNVYRSAGGGLLSCRLNNEKDAINIYVQSIAVDILKIAENAYGVHNPKYVSSFYMYAFSRLTFYIDMHPRSAQHAVARAEPLRSFTPPPVPQGIPRFTFRGIAHPTSEAFPPYLQPEAIFIEGLDQVEMVESVNGDGSLATSPVDSRSQRGGGLSEHQRRNLLITPPRRPLNRLSSEKLAKETEEYESVQESPVSYIDTRSVDLVRLNEESGNDDSRFSADDSLDQETSQSLLPHSQNMDLDSSNVETSQSIIPQSIIPHSEEQGPRLTDSNPRRRDEVEVLRQRRQDGRIFTIIGRVEHVDP
eukprot:g7260.t1